MINFPTIKSLTIPEGNVTKIFDESGNVLWKKGSDTPTITIVVEEAVYEHAPYGTKTAIGNATATIDGVRYGSKSGTFVLQVPVGTVIKCVAMYSSDLDGTGYVSYPGGAAFMLYNYTVTGNATILCKNYIGNIEIANQVITDYDTGGSVTITEG